jgi:hypothetical protein
MALICNRCGRTVEEYCPFCWPKVNDPSTMTVDQIIAEEETLP